MGQKFQKNFKKSGNQYRECLEEMIRMMKLLGNCASSISQGVIPACCNDNIPTWIETLKHEII